MGNSNTKGANSSGETVSTTTTVVAAVTASVVGSVLGFLFYNWAKATKNTPAAVSTDKASTTPSTTTTTTTTSTPKPLKRVDSQIVVDEPTSANAIKYTPSIFDAGVDTKEWKTFDLAEVGLSFKYPSKLAPQQLQNIIVFGNKNSGLVLLTLEKEFTKEETKKVVLLSGRTAPAIVNQEATRKIGRIEGYEYVFTHPEQIQFYAVFIPCYGRTFMLQYEMSDKSTNLDVVKAIVSTIAIKESQPKGVVSVKTKTGIKMKVPSIFYLLRVADEVEDESSVLHVLDGRKKKDISSGIRIFKRKQVKELPALIKSRREELQEYKPTELGELALACGSKGTILNYTKKIKGNVCDLMEVCFIFNECAYIAQMFSLSDLTDEFSSQGLKCIKSIDFVENVTNDVVIYERPEEGFCIQVPALLNSIIEQPLVKELLCEFSHDVNKDVEFHTVVLKGKRSPTIKSIQDFQEVTVAELETQSKSFRAKLQTDLFKLKKQEITKINGVDCLVLILSTLHHVTSEPVVNYSTYFLHANVLFTVQSQITEMAYTDEVEKDIAAIHSSVIIQ